MTINNCILYRFPKIQDRRGNLTFIEGAKHIPFNIKRIYYLYDVPGGSKRGGHAHKNLNQILIALSGSFDVMLYDGKEKKMVHLNSPQQGLIIVPMVWREIINFSSGAVCLVLASEHYSEDDYFRTLKSFRSSLR